MFAVVVCAHSLQFSGHFWCADLSFYLHISGLNNTAELRMCINPSDCQTDHVADVGQIDLVVKQITGILGLLEFKSRIVSCREKDYSQYE